MLEGLRGPAGRRRPVPGTTSRAPRARGRRAGPGPLAEITVKFDPALLELARDFLTYCRTQAIEPARVDDVSTLKRSRHRRHRTRFLDAASLKQNEQQR